MLTVSDIKSVEFQKVMRGYKDEEVDEFLEEVSGTITQLNDEIGSLKNIINSLNKEIAGLKGNIAEWEKKYDETLTKYGELENSLYTTLESAKKLMQDISAASKKRANALLTNAQLDAENMLKQAKLKSDEMLAEAQGSLKNLRREENFLKDKVANSRSIYKSMLKNEMDTLDKIDIEIFGEKIYDDFEKSLVEEFNK